MRFLYVILLIFCFQNCKKDKKINHLDKLNKSTVVSIGTEQIDNKKPLIISEEKIPLTILNTIKEYLQFLIKDNSELLEVENDKSFDIGLIKVFKTKNNYWKIYQITGKLLPSKIDYKIIGVYNKDRHNFGFHTSLVDTYLNIKKYTLSNDNIYIYGVYDELGGLDNKKGSEDLILIISSDKRNIDSLLDYNTN